MSRKTRNAKKRRILISAGDAPVRKASLDMDETNIKIISTLVSNPEKRSKDLAKDLGIPISTMQRRRAILERTILRKKYSIDVKKLGWRTGELFIFASRGASEAVAKRLL